MKKYINILLLVFYISFSVGFTITNHLCKCETKVIEQVSSHSCCSSEKETKHCSDESDFCCEAEDCCSDEIVDIKIEDLYLVESNNIKIYSDVVIINIPILHTNASKKINNNFFIEKPTQKEKLFILNCTYLI